MCDLDSAAKNILAAVRDLRAYLVEEELEEDDPHGQFIAAKIKALQKLADKLSPPKEAKDGNVLQYRPRSR